MSPVLFVVIPLVVLLIMYLSTVGPDWIAKGIAAMLMFALVIHAVFEIAAAF